MQVELISEVHAKGTLQVIFPSVACLYLLFRFHRAKWGVKALPPPISPPIRVPGFHSFLRVRQGRLIGILCPLSLLFCQWFGQPGKSLMLTTSHTEVFLFIMIITVPYSCFTAVDK